MPKKVLVVDDSKTALLMEREILEKRTPYECVTAADGQEALEKAKVERPDLDLDGRSHAAHERLRGLQDDAAATEHA